MKKIVTLIIFISGVAHANEPPRVPTGYGESGSLGEIFYKISNHEQHLIGIFGRKMDDGKRSIWFTDCVVIKNYGIPELICKTEQEGLMIVTNADNYGMLFGAEDEDLKGNYQQNSIHYKIDSSPIIEVDNVIVPSIQGNRIVLALKGAENITYSYKKKNTYATKIVNLSGLKESLDFARKTIQANP